MFQSDGEMIQGAVHPVDPASHCAVHPSAEIDVIQVSVEAKAAGMPSSCSGLTAKWHPEVSLRPLQATMLADAPLVKDRAARIVASLRHQFAEFARVLGPTC
ncbi:unnamed protein product [Symbiodinium sp. CCMP2592]|nr:unnamed protein product [Symbiodinium sp. CCMP2592]